MRRTIDPSTPTGRSIRMFGVPTAHEAGESLDSLSSRPTRLALLLYLAMEGEVSREALASLFWSDRSPRVARRNLSQALYELKEAAGEEWIRASRDRVAIAPEVEVDAQRFLAAAEAEEHDRALSIYSAPFLEDFQLRGHGAFERWADRTRTRIDRIARQSFRAAISTARSQSDGHRVVDLARRWSTMDPLDDEAAHELILALVRSGSRSDALRYYDTFERGLRDELDVEPLERTRDLIGLVRARSSSELRPEATPEPDAAAGSRFPELGEIPGLEVLALIGKGEAGEVYKAREPALGRIVAVKVLSTEMAASEEALLRFERETLVLAGLHHPSIAPIHRAGLLVDGRPYFVARHIRGPTLADRLASGDRFSPSEITRIASELASALTAVHAAGLIHRDIHPSNVLLEEAGGRAVLTDFGLAGILDREAHDTYITATGSELGHPEYRAPEGSSGPAVTDRADIFSLGVLIHELLHGHTPIAARLRRMELERRDADLDALIARCLHANPRRRPSARRIVESMARASLDGVRARRLPREVALIGGVVLAIVALIVVLQTVR